VRVLGVQCVTALRALGENREPRVARRWFGRSRLWRNRRVCGGLRRHRSS